MWVCQNSGNRQQLFIGTWSLKYAAGYYRDRWGPSREQYKIPGNPSSSWNEVGCLHKETSRSWAAKLGKLCYRCLKEAHCYGVAYHTV